MIFWSTKHMNITAAQKKTESMRGRQEEHKITWGTQTWTNWCLTWLSAHNPFSFRTWTSWPSAPSLQKPTKTWLESAWLTDQRRHKLNKWKLPRHNYLDSWIFNQNWPNSSRDDQVSRFNLHTYASSKKKDMLINPTQLLYHSSNTYNVINQS